MLWLTLVIGYLVAGFITAAVTMYIFPSGDGFRPVTLMVTAIVVFTLLWPVLVLLAL